MDTIISSSERSGIKSVQKAQINYAYKRSHTVDPLKISLLLPTSFPIWNKRNIISLRTKKSFSSNVNSLNTCTGALPRRPSTNRYRSFPCPRSITRSPTILDADHGFSFAIRDIAIAPDAPIRFADPCVNRSTIGF